MATTEMARNIMKRKTKRFHCKPTNYAKDDIVNHLPIEQLVRPLSHWKQFGAISNKHSLSELKVIGTAHYRDNSHFSPSQCLSNLTLLFSPVDP